MCNKNCAECDPPKILKSKNGVWVWWHIDAWPSRDMLFWFYAANIGLVNNRWECCILCIGWVGSPSPSLASVIGGCAMGWVGSPPPLSPNKRAPYGVFYSLIRNTVGAVCNKQRHTYIVPTMPHLILNRPCREILVWKPPWYQL